MHALHGPGFTGSRVLVTRRRARDGGGRAPERLGRRGAGVAVTDLQSATAHEVVKGLEPGSDREHLAVELDVTDDGSVPAGWRRPRPRRLGGLDVLVDLAGGSVPHDDFEWTLPSWSRVIDLNLVERGSARRPCRASLPHLRPGRGAPGRACR